MRGWRSRWIGGIRGGGVLRLLSSSMVGSKMRVGEARFWSILVRGVVYLSARGVLLIWEEWSQEDLEGPV